MSKYYQVVFVLVVLVIWETVGSQSTNELLRMASPGKVAAAFIELALNGVLLSGMADSVRRVSVGYFYAAIVGVPLGLLFGRIIILYVLSAPIIGLLRPIPPIAWIPVAIAIFSFGDGSAYFVIFIGAFFPILSNAFLGAKEVDKDYIDVSISLGASKFRRFIGVIVPSSLPSLFAGLKIGLGFAWMCVVAAEMIGAQSGLGYLIQLYRQILRFDMVIVCMIMIGLTGYVMAKVLDYLEWLVLYWRRDKIILKASAKRVPDFDSADFITINSVRPRKVEMKDVVFSYSAKGQNILNGVNLEVEPSEIFCVIGQSGCGKSTLLRTIAGLEKYKGSILINAESLDSHLPEIVMMFQSLALFPWKTSVGNVVFPMMCKNHSRSSAMNRAMFLLNAVGLAHKARSFPGRLSGGQKQRVALARALAASPSVILMDEPFAALDSQIKHRLQIEFAALFKDNQITAIIVTHDIDEAIFMGDRVAVMTTDGKLMKPVSVNFDRPRSHEIVGERDFIMLRNQLSDQLGYS